MPWTTWQDLKPFNCCKMTQQLELPPSLNLIILLPGWCSELPIPCLVFSSCLHVPSLSSLPWLSVWRIFRITQLYYSWLSSVFTSFRFIPKCTGHPQAYINWPEASFLISNSFSSYPYFLCSSIPTTFTLCAQICQACSEFKDLELSFPTPPEVPFPSVSCKAHAVSFSFFSLCRMICLIQPRPSWRSHLKCLSWTSLVHWLRLHFQ